MISPRNVPDRDSKYMGLAWIHASFSKDPSTQVGAQIVSAKNDPLGSGYNGPPRRIGDDSFSWQRPPADDPDAFSKYDVIMHAEHNALKRCRNCDLTDAVCYVTALPCPGCMRELVEAEIGRVVYFDYQGDSKSSLQNAKWQEKSFELARLGGINLEVFKGDISWVCSWADHLFKSGIALPQVVDD